MSDPRLQKVSEALQVLAAELANSLIQKSLELAEIGKLQSDMLDLARLNASQVVPLRFENMDLRQERDRLREALKPFADWGAAFMRPDTLGDSCPLGCIPESPCKGSPNIRDLKRAYAALHPTESAPEATDANP